SAHTRLAGSCRGHVQRRPARLEYNSEHKSNGTVEVFQTPAHEHRQRTNEGSLRVESIPNRGRNRIRVAKIRRALCRKIRCKRRVQLKPAHALRGEIAVEGSAARHVWRRWQSLLARRFVATHERPRADRISILPRKGGEFLKIDQCKIQPARRAV